MNIQPPNPPSLVEFDEESGRIYFPVRKDEADSFFRSLLGRQQTTGVLRPAPFLIDRNDIVQWFHLISQRVSQQNTGLLASTLFRIQFSDGFKASLNSLEEFEAFVPTGQRRCTGITIELAFILRYIDKPSPERQDVELTIKKVTPHDMAVLPPTFLMPFLPDNVIIPSGFVELEIRHTARTWAEDIQNLTKQHFDAKDIAESSARRFFRKFRKSLALFASLLVGATGGFLFFEHLNKRSLELEAALNGVPSLDDRGLEMRLDAITSFLNETSVLIPFSLMMAFMFSFTFFTVLGGRMIRGLGAYPESFILFSDADKSAMAKARQSANRTVILAVLTWLFSVLASIAANIVYAFLQVA